MWGRIHYEDPEFNLICKKVFRSCSVNRKRVHFKVPSAVFSSGKKRYRIIGVSPRSQTYDLKIILFDEFSEFEEVYVLHKIEIRAEYAVPLKIEGVLSSIREPSEEFPRKFFEKGSPSFVSTIGNHVIMNHFPLNVACQRSRRQRFIIRETTRLVGYGSFSRNYRIRTVVFPPSVEYIGGSSFYQCTLRFIHFKGNSRLKKIGNRSFMYSRIEKFCFPSSVSEICNSAFSGCHYLRSVTFSEDSKLKKIGKDAFSQSGIDSIIIPPNVEVIGSNAFNKCENLRSIEYRDKSKIRFE